jgi:hypothetical protein
MENAFHVMLQIPDSDVASLLISAFEGGVRYWARYSSKQSKAPKRHRRELDDAGAQPDYGTGIPDADCYPYLWPLLGGELAVLITEENDAPPFWLMRHHLDQGLSIMAKKHPRHFGNLLAGNADAETADVFVQLAMFGEVVYG